MRRAMSLLGVAAMAALPAYAWAEAPDDGGQEAPGDARSLVGTGLFLRGLEAAGPNRATASAAGFGGFDGARGTPLFEAAAEVALGRRVSVRGGGSYAPARDDRGSVRPSVVVRVNLLEQAGTGVDLSVLAAYRQERFDEDGGLIQVGAAAGRR